MVVALFELRTAWIHRPQLILVGSIPVKEFTVFVITSIDVGLGVEVDAASPLPLDWGHFQGISGRF